MQNIKQAIKETYGSTAEQAESTVDGARRVAQAFGYSKEELDAIPKESNMGLSCGNPTAIASLKQGEVVLDLGSGGGLDCFLAATKVGTTGRVIGVDMTPSMIELATRNAIKFGKDNVEFRQGDIEDLPVEDGTVDCVISNCVINLSTDKQKVFNEVFRVLKPGGRLAVSDICIKKELASELKEAVMAYVGCISGALLVGTYKDMMTKSGFKDIDVIDSSADLNAYALLSDNKSVAACCASATSLPEAAIKSGGGGCCGEKNASKETKTSGGGGGGCCGEEAKEKASGAACCSSPAKTTGGCCDASSGFGQVTELLKQYDVNEYAGSFKIFAVKPLQS